MQNITNTQFGVGLVLVFATLGISMMLPTIAQEYVGYFSFAIATVIGAITFFVYLAEKRELTESRMVYLKFLDYMYKQGRGFQKEIFPTNTKWHRLWRRIFGYKPPSDKKLADVKFRYSRWRLSLHDAVKIIFEVPTSPGVFPPSILFGNGHLDAKVDWGRQLLMDLEAVEFLKKIKSVGFEEKFDQAPLKLNEYKEYLA